MASLPMLKGLVVSGFLVMGRADAAWRAAWIARLVGLDVVLAKRAEHQTDSRAPPAGQSVLRFGLWMGR
jgi:hypothetical protein